MPAFLEDVKRGFRLKAPRTLLLSMWDARQGVRKHLPEGNLDTVRSRGPPKSSEGPAVVDLEGSLRAALSLSLREFHGRSSRYRIIYHSRSGLWIKLIDRVMIGRSRAARSDQGALRQLGRQ